MRALVISAITGALLLLAASIIIPLSLRPAQATTSLPPDGKIDDCVPTDLDQVADFTGTTHLVWNCPEDENGNDVNEVRYAEFDNDASSIEGAIQTLATGVGDTDVATILYDGGAAAMPLVVVNNELESFTCDPECEQSDESPSDPTPSPPPPTTILTVKKNVINDNEGTNEPSDFIIHVNGTNVHCVDPDPAVACTESENSVEFSGSEAGTNVTMDPGDYFIFEEKPSGYVGPTYSGDCEPDVDQPSIGRGTIESGDQQTCTLTNNDGFGGPASFDELGNAHVISVTALTTQSSHLVPAHGTTSTINNLIYDADEEPHIIPVHKWSILLEEVLGAKHPVGASGPGKIVYAAWEDDGQGGEKDIFFNVGEVQDTDNDGEDDTIDWRHDSPLNLSNSDGRSSHFPRIASTGNNVYVFWEEDIGNKEIAFSRSTDAGMHFNGGTDEDPVGDPRILSGTSGESRDHEIAVDGQNVYLVWRDSSTGSGDIYFKRSTNGGQDFRANQRIERTANPSHEPDIAAKTIGGRKIVDLVWSDERRADQTKHSEAIFVQSTDGGNRFAPQIDVSNNVGESTKVLVSITRDNERFVAWLDNDPDFSSDQYRIFAVKSTTTSGTRFDAPMIYSDSKDRAAFIFDLDDKTCAWDTHCRRCQSLYSYGYNESRETVIQAPNLDLNGWSSYFR